VDEITRIRCCPIEMLLSFPLALALLLPFSLTVVPDYVRLNLFDNFTWVDQSTDLLGNRLCRSWSSTFARPNHFCSFQHFHFQNKRRCHCQHSLFASFCIPRSKDWFAFSIIGDDNFASLPEVIALF
jgi:hypothetical protein